MPVYNPSPSQFKESVESILNQSIKNIELIIIDDGSDLDFSRFGFLNDPRVILLKHGSNKGISKALNYGLDIANGEYIARMDSDDISLPLRFSRQIELLKKHKIVSSRAIHIDKNNREISKSSLYPFNNLLKRIMFYFFCLNVSYHPSIMARSEVFKTNRYDSEFNGAEDLELFLRIKSKYKIYFDSSILIKYRVKEVTQKVDSPTIESLLIYRDKIRKIKNKYCLFKAFFS